MSSSQRFCLRWNNHQSNLLSVFEQLLQDESFVDVTLAVEGLYLKAHKMVLSACSPYFQTLFVNNPDKHPIVFLKDVPYSDMRSLLDFMYKGEVSVDQERLTAFLKVAESLRIKGLTEVNEEKCDLPSITSSLLSSVGSSGDESRHMGPHHLLGHKRQSSSPSPLHHLHHSSMATYPPKRKRGRPRKLSGSELEASSLVGVVVGGVPHNNNHLSDIDLPSEKGDGGLVLQGPPELLETRVDPPHMTKDRHMSPHRGSPAHMSSHHDRSTASRSPDDLHKDMPLRKVKDEPEPTPGTSSHDPSQGYSRNSNSQDSDGGGAGSGSSVAGGSYNTDLVQETQHSWGAGVHFLTSDANSETTTPVIRAYRSRSVIIKAEDGGFHAALLKTEDEQVVEEEDDNGLYLHGGEDETPLAKHELLEYVIQHDGSVICKWCGETLPSRTHWYRHKYRVHAVNLYKCTKCNMFFKTKKGYLGHVGNRHGNEEDIGEEQVLVEEDIHHRRACYTEVIEEHSSATSVVVSTPREQEVISPQPLPAQQQPPPRSTRGSEWDEERQREERLVAEIIDRVRRECEAQGSATLSRRRYTRRSTVMNS